MSVSELSHYIRVDDDGLPKELCSDLVAAFDGQLSQFQQRNGRGVRGGLDDSAWTELDLGRIAAPGLMTLFRDHVAQAFARYNAALGLTLPLSPIRKLAPLIIKRYRNRDGEQFQPHFDSLGEVSNRYLVVLWYLNDVADGGETEFIDLGIKVAPKAGRRLIFPPYWMFQHAGRPPVSGDKYILSTYLLY